jgi:molecular chaperone GrpE
MNQEPEVIVPAEPAGKGPEASPESPAALDDLLAAKSQEVDRLQGRLLRLQAEFENYKKRMAREKTDYLKFATESLLLEFLPILDNLERGVASARAEAAPTALVDGFDMIARLFRSTLDKAGVKPMDAVGKPFDPSLHQAIAQVDVPDGPENVVVEEIQKGFLLEGRVLRAAMVKVSRVPASSASAPIDEGACA